MTAPTITLVGHPYTPIGMGEHVRCTFRALRSASRQVQLHDIYKLTEPNPGYRIELLPFETRTLADINIFHINGNEVEQTLAHIGGIDPSAYNIVYPLWELPRYPAVWARELERFDEIWAPSRFVADSIAAQTSKPVMHMPLACEVMLESFLGRRYFGIAEAPYTFLFFFDLRSYMSRKNPEAVLEAFRQFVVARSFANVTLVIKVNGAEHAPEALQRLKALVDDLDDHVALLVEEMTDNEVKNLVRCCDCFVSLHRSEGFGFGIAQAMALDKPVIATAYSGNMDFMTDETSLMVAYGMVAVPEGAYPHAEGQQWAEPSIDDAVGYMMKLVDTPRAGYELGVRAGRHIRANYGLRATGRRIARRLDAIASSNAADGVEPVGQNGEPEKSASFHAA